MCNSCIIFNKYFSWCILAYIYMCIVGVHIVLTKFVEYVLGRVTIRLENNFTCRMQTIIGLLFDSDLVYHVVEWVGKASSSPTVFNSVQDIKVKLWSLRICFILRYFTIYMICIRLIEISTTILICMLILTALWIDFLLQMFRKLHNAYVDMLCNPFYTPGENVTSR